MAKCREISEISKKVVQSPCKDSFWTYFAVLVGVSISSPCPLHACYSGKTHNRNQHEISENPLTGTAGRHPGKNAPFCQFSILNNRKSLGHWPVDPCLSCRVSQGHPAGTFPLIFWADPHGSLGCTQRGSYSAKGLLTPPMTPSF